MIDSVLHLPHVNSKHTPTHAPVGLTGITFTWQRPLSGASSCPSSRAVRARSFCPAMSAYSKVTRRFVRCT